MLATLMFFPLPALATGSSTYHCPATPLSTYPHFFSTGDQAKASDVTDNFDWFQQCPYFTGKVGVGTNSPAAKLDVAGEVKIGSTGLTCGATTAGAMRYNAGTMQYCNGTVWTNIYGGAGLSLSTVTVNSSPICVGIWDQVQCPSGYVVSGCSWYLSSWGQVLSPVPDSASIYYNGCGMYVGGSGLGSCFVVQATCLKVQ